jgi:hypothetical protein
MKIEKENDIKIIVLYSGVRNNKIISTLAKHKPLIIIKTANI